MHRLHRTIPLPAVGTLLNQPGYVRLQDRYPRHLVADALREELALERKSGRPAEPGIRLAEVEVRLEFWVGPRLRPVINGTGVVLHTNLGRAPLSAPAVAEVAQVASRYCNLELDLETGRRGERHALIGDLLRRISGAESALVVNNNAAAVLLMLTVLARRREVVVSRGQLVEIGGSFRMPDVMRLSGARMVEVGTTNRTRAADYEEAITDRTAALLRVHTSNFRVTGFTESAALAEMEAVTRRHGVLLLDDLGSGALAPVGDEPTVKESLAHADVVAFSGDKLLGGPQAGILLGRADLIRRMARHPLARAVRADKMTLAALEATLRERILGRFPPVAGMLAMTKEELYRRAARLRERLLEHNIPCQLAEAESAAGGGSLPNRGFPTWLVQVEGRPSLLAAALRRGNPAVLTRIEHGHCCIDVRTLLPADEEGLLVAIEAAVVSLGNLPQPSDDGIF
jgi:L-seryl-tRNA(Ser) seleniumtransferase